MNPGTRAVWLSSIYRTLATMRWHRRGARLARRLADRSSPLGPSSEAREPPSRLRDDFEAHAEGPGIQKWLHYFEAYERHLAKFVGRSPVVAEVGVFSGGSLPMWRRYFGPGCHVHGIDIDPGCKAFEADGITIHIGDQADRAMWNDFRRAVPGLDILVDDGGHTPQQQRVTLEEMLPHLRPGGVYICEDVHGERNGFAQIAGALAAALNAGRIESLSGVDAITPTSFQATIHSMHFYPFLLVIEKREACAREFLAPLRGTQWRGE